MKSFIIPPSFKLYRKNTFILSINHNNWPIYDAEEINKKEQQEAILKLYQ